MKISERFQSLWINFGLPGVREISSTYAGSDFSRLPTMGTIPSGWTWLGRLPLALSGAGMAGNNYLTTWAEQLQRVHWLRELEPDGVPTTLWELLASRKLQSRIPSCTACYFDLPLDWTASPFREGDQMLRFMNDQQCCYCWYLYVPTDQPPFVIASSCVGGNEDFLEEVDFKSHPELVDNAWLRTFFVAPGFDEFIRRFWLENLIWFKLVKGLKLLEREADYLRQIDPTWNPRLGRAAIGRWSGVGAWFTSLWKR